MQKAIEVTNLCKQYSQEVLKNFSLSVNEGEMVVLLGESGCGKSTFIRILAGLENADSGSVYLNGIFMTGLLPIKEILHWYIRSRYCGIICRCGKISHMEWQKKIKTLFMN